MMSKQVRVSYDRTVDAAYIRLGETLAAGSLVERVVKTYCCDPGEVDGMINLDFDDGGRLVGIEVLNASKKLPVHLLNSPDC
ncbi:MAG TPA: DUF2283 domain-containing protein [Rhizomicrobium sp.]|jgi:uncharacterized protein YuzE